MSYPIGLQVLRAKIRGFQETGATITARITKSEKDRKHRLWQQKRALGNYCRYHLVAYGLLRGVPYDRIERCAPNNKLDPEYLRDLLVAHGGSKWSNLEEVKSLLSDTPTVPTAAAPSVAPNVQASKPTSLLQTVKKLLAGPQAAPERTP